MGRDHPRYNTSFLFTVHLGIPDTRLALYRLSPARATVIGNKARSIGANAPSYTVYSMKYAHGFFLLWGGYNIFLLLIHYIFTHILQGYCTTIVSLYYCHVPVKQPPWKTWVKFICYKRQQKNFIWNGDLCGPLAPVSDISNDFSSFTELYMPTYISERGNCTCVVVLKSWSIDGFRYSPVQSRRFQRRYSYLWI